MKKRRSLLLTLFFLAVLIGLPVWSIYRQVRQARLNRDLIVAIKQNETAKAIALLSAGADANTTARSETPVSARHVLREWWNRLWGKKPAPATFYPAALIVVLKPILYEDSWEKGMDSDNSLGRALLDHGADPNVRDEKGNTALMFAARNGFTATARLLLDRGADVNARATAGNTALMCAPHDQPNGMIELLLAHGAEVNTRDKIGNTALIYACFGCYRQGLERLLAAGANVNIADKNGFTPLMRAAQNGNTVAVQLLLNHGADCQVKAPNGETALSLAKYFGYNDCVRLLKQHSARK